MKTDLDLIRQVLLNVESSAKPLLDLSISGFDQSALNEIILLCSRAGLIQAVFDREVESLNVHTTIHSLTANGIEFLQLAMNELLWEDAKRISNKRNASFSLEMLFAFLRQESARLVSNPHC